MILSAQRSFSDSPSSDQKRFLYRRILYMNFTSN